MVSKNSNRITKKLNVYGSRGLSLVQDIVSDWKYVIIILCDGSLYGWDKIPLNSTEQEFH